METQSRWKSWPLWVSIAALIAFTSKTYFGYEIPEFDKFVNLVLVVLAGAGIVNNPSDSQKF